jgi:hypothetical protein
MAFRKTVIKNSGSDEQEISCRIWGSHSGGYEKFIFWDITLCSPLKVN